MKEIKLFECEFYKKQYADEHLCKECERRHMIPQEIVRSEYNSYLFINYPNTITVLMSDGKKVEYYQHRILSEVEG